MPTLADRVRLADQYLDRAIRHLQALPDGRDALLLALKARASLLEQQTKGGEGNA
jgi:hypothetical protein